MAQLLSGTRIYGNTSIDSQLIVGNVSPYATTTNTNGSLIVTGGMGITGNIYIGGSSSRLTFPDGTSMNTAASGTGSGAAASGYLANSVIFANTSGYLANTTALQYFASNNSIKTTANIQFYSLTQSSNTVTIQFNTSSNTLDFIFT
jgi:hypothetical protein